MPSTKPPFLFLSHSGADTDAARELKRRILESPTAQAADLRVWFDKDDLEAGESWQQQLERAITEQATAFAVYVGSQGVLNWVDREVRLGLSRATGPDAIPFIPILGEQAMGAAALPPFAQQHQAVRDPLVSADELAKLIKAVLSTSETRRVVLTSDPFVGLRAMTERETDRFFGRDVEIAEVIAKLMTNRLVAIVSESGSGKSSLARAGVVPAFRGGSLEDLSKQEPDDRAWHVVVMRPGSNPLEGLKRAVTETAERLGLSGQARAGLRERIAFSDPSETAYALRCDLPVTSTETLLVIDQFEEVLTQTAAPERAPFIDFLLALIDQRTNDGFRVLITLRADYFNLCRAHEAFYARLQQDHQSAVYRLKGISEAGLAKAVREPLKMAGHDDVEQQMALLDLFRRDVQDRPGDLALIQMALFVVWRRRRQYDGDLVNAYVAVNGISGALADEADRIRREKLSEGQSNQLLPIFVRLIRLGEAGGATRRIAQLDEFAAHQRALVQDLAKDEYGRLLLVREDAAEISHEALITQWGWLQNQINHNGPQIRRLARLMEDADNWSRATDAEKAQHLANQGDLAHFQALKQDHPDWLTACEAEFVDQSKAAIERSEVRRRYVLVGAVAASVIFLVLAATAWIFKERADENAERAIAGELKARENEKTAIANQAAALAALSSVELERNPAKALKLALAGWPRNAQDQLPALAVTFNALGDALKRNPLPVRLNGPVGGVIAWSPDGSRVATSSTDTTALVPFAPRRYVARVWDVATGKDIAVLKGHQSFVIEIAWSPDGTRLATGSVGGEGRVWNARTGEEIAVLTGHERHVVHVAWSPDGTRVATSSLDGTGRVWHAATGVEIAVHRGHGDDRLLAGSVRPIAWNLEGTRLATASPEDKYGRIWDAATGTDILLLKGHKEGINHVAWSPDGTRLATASSDKTGRVWDAMAGTEIAALEGHVEGVHHIAWSPNGTRLGAVAGLVGIEGGVVSGVFNLESSGVEAPDWRPRHDEQYHEA